MKLLKTSKIRGGGQLVVKCKVESRRFASCILPPIATILCAVAFVPSAIAETTFTDWALSADTALTDDVVVAGTLTIPSGVTLNLNGRTLSVAAIAGTGTIIAAPPKYIDENREYIALEYIKTDGRQYFDTGVRANTTTDAIKADCTVVPLAANNNAQVILGAGRTVGNTRNDMVLYLTASKWWINHGLSSSAAGSSTTYAKDAEYVVSALWKSDDTHIAVNGKTVATRSSPTAFDAGINLCAFARNKDGTPDLYNNMFVRCGEMTISQSEDTPVRHFVPAKHNGVAGMYDTLGSGFYPSATSTPFIDGPELVDDYAQGSQIKLLDDIDFTALGVTFGGTVPSFDANGKRLTVPSSVVGGRLTITSSVAGGVLEVDVASGSTASSANMSLTGSLKLVKKGAGTLAADRGGQTYSGGTLVEAGTLKCGVNGDAKPFGPEWGDAGGNLVRNGDFEQCTIASGDAGYLPNDGATAPGWEYSGSAGITKPGKTWTSVTSGLGSYAMFLQGTGAVWQDIEVATPGIYSFSFNDVTAKGKSANTMNLLLIDIANCATNTILRHTPGSSTSLQSRYGIVYVPAAGTYRLMVESTTDGDNSNVYDNFKFALLSDTEQGKITVGAGAAFELDGKYTFDKYRFVLNGGTIVNNTGTDVSDGVVNLVNVRLEADSAFCATNSAGLIAPCGYGPTVLDLNSHTLTVRTAANKYFWLYHATVVNGTLDDNTSGWLKIDKYDGVRSIGADLVGGGAMDVQVDCLARDYTATYSGSWTAGAGFVKVSRTFKPKVDRFHGVAMQNGSTLDLTEWPSSAGWPMQSNFTNGDGVKGVTFAAGTANSPTAVTVRLDANRADVKALACSKTDGAYCGYLLRWNDKPEHVVFSLDAASASKYKLVSNGTGLMLRPLPGFMLIVR